MSFLNRADDLAMLRPSTCCTRSSSARGCCTTRRNCCCGNLTPAHVTKVLDSLERIGLVERLRPITASSRAKKTAYAISDQFLRFHYRFVEPARSQLRTLDLARAYVDAHVLPALDHHVSRAWEDICRQHVLQTVPGVTRVGRWWGQVPTGAGRHTETREIDVAGVDAQGTLRVAGMCKWTNDRVDFDELNLLERLLPYVESGTARPARYLFSRKGFTRRLVDHASNDPGLHLVAPAAIYAEVGR